MKSSIQFILLILVFGAQTLNAQISNVTNHVLHFPKPLHWANDMERSYSPDQLENLDTLLSNFEKRTNVKIKLVTVDDLYAKSYKFDEIVEQIGTYKLNKKSLEDSKTRTSYNFILILVTQWGRRAQVYSELPYHKIGIVLDNKESNSIFREASYPLWNNQQFYEGTVNGLEALLEKISQKLQLE